MDLLTVFEEEQNIEDRLAYMSEEAGVHVDCELSFRLLRHLRVVGSAQEVPRRGRRYREGRADGLT